MGKNAFTFGDLRHIINDPNNVAIVAVQHCVALVTKVGAICSVAGRVRRVAKRLVKMKQLYDGVAPCENRTEAVLHHG